ncbi:hypothetical protein A2U01_0067342, partial [Trifolium medium]|nr:hypothetical protein [Trifolium medium]
KQAEEEEVKAEEEKKKQEEVNTSDKVVIEPSEDKGKEVASELDPLVLILQEQLATHKAEQELLKEEVKNLSESQHNIIKTQENINSKLDAILAFMSIQP